jgi:Restriction endonuclease
MSTRDNVMPNREEYEAMILPLGWHDLRSLWERIKIRDTPGWDGGKAFEYLVLRAFQLDGAVIRWPYPVYLYGQTEIVEEIDGSVRVGGLYSLVESKDEDGNIAIAPIAKLRNQLLRRPAGTFGMVFSSHRFTDPAIQLAQFALPQSIILWTGDQVEYALKNENICELCEMKYRMCVDHGMPDFDVTTGAIA